MAARYGWNLVTTVQLFDWVCRFLKGDKDAAHEVESALGLAETEP